MLGLDWYKGLCLPMGIDFETALGQKIVLGNLDYQLRLLVRIVGNFRET